MGQIKNALERASDPGRVLAEAADAGKVSMTKVLQAVGFDANNASHQAALLVSNKYGLDPLLKHVVVIPGGRGVYVTRDGYLHIAHTSGQFDGIEVVEERDTDEHFVAKVSVWRKDMTRPFTYTGRYPKNGSNAKHGPEMAIKVAEVMAMRRAFNVAGIPAKEEAWDIEEHHEQAVVAVDEPVEQPAEIVEEVADDVVVEDGTEA